MTDVEDTTTLQSLRRFVEQVRDLRKYQRIRDQDRNDYNLAFCKKLENSLDEELSRIPKDR